MTSITSLCLSIRLGTVLATSFNLGSLNFDFRSRLTFDCGVIRLVVIILTADVVRRFELVFLLSWSELLFAAGVIRLSAPLFVIRFPELL